MKKGLLILIVGIAICFCLTGCNSDKNDSNGKTVDKYTMDFDKDGSKETFYLTKKGKGKEAEFKLWYKKDGLKKLIEKSLALNDGTKLFLYEADKNYVVLNIAQSTLGKNAKVYVYYVNNGKCQIADKISGAQIFKKKDELFVLKGSYCRFDNELQAWNATSEQEYHVTIAGGKIVDYKSKELSQKEFEKYNNAKEVWSDIEKQINKEYGYESINAVKYIDRDDGTIDVNVVTTLPNSDKIKQYVTLTKSADELRGELKLKGGNKELSFDGDLFNNLEQNIVVEKYKNNKESLYKYTVYSSNGKKIYTENEIHREPLVNRVDDKIVSVSWSAGTGVDMVRYFDLDNCKKSKVFETPLDVRDKKVITYDGKSIVIQNMFDKSEFYKKISLKGVSSVTVEAEFLDDNKIKVKYATGEDYKDKVEVIKLK